MNAKYKHAKSLTIMHAVTVVTIATIMTLSLASFTGCAASSTSSRITQEPNPIPIATAEYDLIFQASLDTLQDSGFRLNRQDYRFGVVSTYPKASPTLFEPWHTDNTTAYQAISSTTNYQRRRVSIRLIPNQTKPISTQTDHAAAVQDIASNSAIAPPAGYLLDAQVLIEQVETPLRYLSGSTSQGRMFRDLRSAPADLSDRQIKDNYWRVIGRDTGLEHHLLAQILRKKNQLAQNKPQPLNSDTPAER